MKFSMEADRKYTCKFYEIFSTC